MPTYQYSNIKSAINIRIFNKINMIGDIRGTINTAVREVISLINFRSMKRYLPLTPFLFSEFYSYQCPSDLKNTCIVDIQPQEANRSQFQDWSIVSESQFDQRKQIEGNIISFTDRSFIRQLKISLGQGPNKNLVIDPLNSISGNGGTWITVGNATNLVVDTFNYIKGNASLKFDLGAGSSTIAGIQNLNLSFSDITQYYQNGSVFVFAYITNLTNINSYTLLLGSDSSNYYSMTVNMTNEQTSFQVGWNTMRFDFSAATVVGTPVNGSIKYCAIYMNKSTSKINEASYRFDNVQISLGFIYNVVYYSKFAWQTLGGTWIVNSLNDTDYINVDETEYNMILEKCIEHCANAVQEFTPADRASTKFDTLKTVYVTRIWPDDCINETDTYHDFASIDGDDITYGVQL